MTLYLDWKIEKGGQKVMGRAVLAARIGDCKNNCYRPRLCAALKLQWSVAEGGGGEETSMLVSQLKG